MNKYRDKSDFDINKAAAVSLSAEFQFDDIREKLYTDIFRNTEIDYCNNPADAMPIVIENRISIESRFNGHYDEWYASRQLNKMHIDATGTNYYRVAMEVFLMMKDAENEK